MYTEAIAIVNIMNRLEFYASLNRNLNWLLTDMFSEIEERAVTLRLMIVQALNVSVPLSNSFGYTSSLNLLDTILPHQNYFFSDIPKQDPHRSNSQQRFMQQEIILQLPCKFWHLFSECVTSKKMSSFINSDQLEITSRFHAMFCLHQREYACHMEAESYKTKMLGQHNANLLLISWLSRHMIGISRDLGSRAFWCKSTILRRFTDPYLQCNISLARMGGLYAPVVLQYTLIKIRSLSSFVCLAMDVEGGNTNRHAAPRRNSFMMINDFVFLMNKMRLSTPVVFEMENSQLLQDTARQICILYGIIPYPVSFFVSTLLGILHGSI
jgi:hypothetical protein